MIEDRDRIKKERKLQQDNCTICQLKMNGIMQSKKFCVFCQTYVCKSHLIKKRPDPLKSDVLADVCQECEDAILYQIVMQKYAKDETELQLQEDSLLSEMNILQLDIAQLSQDAVQTTRELTQQEEKHQLLIEQYRTQIRRAEQLCDELNQEASNLNDHHRRLIDLRKQVESSKINQQEVLIQTQQERAQQRTHLQQLQQEVLLIKELIDKEQTFDANTVSYASNQMMGTMVLDSQMFDIKQAITKPRITDRKSGTNGYWCV